MNYVIVEVHNDSVHGLSVRTFDAGSDPQRAEMARRALHLDRLLNRPSWMGLSQTFVCKIEEPS